MLSALVLRDQGILVEWITFETPFFSSANARRAARILDIPIFVAKITPVYLEMLKNPPSGYGKQMNPCMDCHALMFRLAGQKMAEDGFDFLFSGEVLGQRPMSQQKNSLRYVEKQSGYEGYILRPLSARSMPETLPEQKGWVDRNRLLDITGRSRKEQMALAHRYGIEDYPSPAGGCLLTDKGFSDRLKDLFQHRTDFSERELYLLKFGRHLRLDRDCKVIVGRTKGDNDHIKRHVDPLSDTVINVIGYPGPVAVIPGGAGREAVLMAAAICAGYSKAPEDQPATVSVIGADGKENVKVLPIPPRDAKRFIL